MFMTSIDGILVGLTLNPFRFITINDHVPIYNVHDCIFTSQIEHRRESLRQMFGTPCHKWHHRGKFPFKLTLQLLKVLVVTLQVGIVTDQVM